VLVALFIGAERRAVEPALPLRLFRSRTFNIASVVSLFVGAAMYGASSYLPTLLQVANGASASDSGLLLVPLMLGMLGTSSVTGQIITRTGRYRIFPLIGTLLAAVGLFLLSTLDTGSSRWESGVFMAVLGMGLGFTMQVMIIASQNETRPEDLGVTTSTVTFFRTVGGSIGVALFGTLFASRLTHLVGDSARGLTPEQITHLPAGERAQMASAVAESITGVFAYGVPLFVIAFLVARLLRETPLRTESAEALRAEGVATTAAIAGGPEMVVIADAPDGDRDGDGDGTLVGTSNGASVGVSAGPSGNGASP
jgi:MFS family permease